MIYLFISLFILSSCELNELSVEEEINYTKGSLNEANLNSSLEFGGVESASYITDTTVSLHWSEVEGASYYIIYDISSSVPVQIRTVLAPADSVFLDRLKSGTDYEFIVRVKDSDGVIDINSESVKITTLTKPTEVDFVLLSNPSSENDILRTPSFYVLGVNPGDIVSLYTDNCSTKVAQSSAITTFVELTVEDELPIGVDYTFKADRYSVNNLSSDCSTAYADYSLLRCPDGYLYVPAYSKLGVDAFCIMQYEARAWSDADKDNIVDSTEVDSDGCNESACTTSNWGASYKPGSTESGKPWVKLDIGTAQNECQSLGSGYDLISNKEWMSVAALIEENTSNWTSGAVGSGSLHQGNNGVSSSGSYNAGEVEGGSSRSYLASFLFENGDVSPARIWDMSGNVSEWVNWDTSNELTFMPYACDDDWAEFSDSFCLGLIDTDLYLPSNPANILTSLYYDSSYGLGLIEAGLGRTLIRGGSYLGAEYTGLYTASFKSSQSSTSKTIGFRCVYRP